MMKSSSLMDPPNHHHPRPHWRWSLATRMATVWALLLGAAVGISSWIVHRDARHRLLGNVRQGIEQDAGEIHLKLETWTRALREDARSFSQSPLVYEFLKKRHKPEEAHWRALLEDEFRAVFAGKPAYFQMRLLAVGGDEDGREIVRLDRNDDRLEVMPPELLQSKSGRDYYQEALQLPAGEIYLSEINLNRDFGHITVPHISTIRAAAKIREKNSGREAMLIINADVNALFGEVHELASPGTEIRLLNSPENYLLHPKDGVAFASDLGRGLAPSAEYPTLHRGSLLSAEPRPAWLRQGESGGELALGTTLDLGGWPSRPLMLMTSLPGEAWYPELVRSRQRAIWATALTALAGAGVAIVVSLPFTSRLRRLSAALRQFDASEVPDLAPDAGKDEIGVAVERFREMSIKVREQIENLQAARDDAEEANAAKEAFLAVMSHEIRTPMNAVVGLIRALEANDPPPRQKPILASLRSSASNLMTLLNTALDYTRLRGGALQYAHENFDAARLVREVGQSFKPSAMAKHLDLKIDAPDVLVVRGDPVRLRQVVNNLVNNAVKFTNRGFVRISLRHADGSLLCAVADSGPGIEPADREIIFAPFESIAREAGRVETGAGLGLAVSRELVEQQGGALSLDSRPGQGATFTVRLPYPKALATASASGEDAGIPKSDPAAVYHARPRQGLRLLYVEDVPSNQEVMAYTLEGIGACLVTAETGAEALRLLEEHPFDLVLVDLQLPDMAGDELGQKIAASHPGLSMVAVTAQSSPAAAERCRQAGMAAVILKPYTAAELLHVIAEHAITSQIISLEVLESLHPDHPERSRKLAGAMASEIRAAAGQLEALSPADDWEMTIETARTIRHKLTTAIARFQLDEIGRLLDHLIETGEESPTLIRQGILLLNTAADDLEKWSRHGPSVQV